MLVCDSAEGRSCGNEASDAGDKSFFLLLQRDVRCKLCNGVGDKRCCISFGGGNSPPRPTHRGPVECLRPTREASD